MCDYKFRAGDKRYIDPENGHYCPRPSAFWIQSLLSTHNSHSCPQHLSRIVREIEKCAKEFDIGKAGIRNPDMRYAIDGVDGFMTSRAANYARVTVKPYTEKGN